MPKRLQTANGGDLSALAIGGRPDDRPVDLRPAVEAGVNCFFFYSVEHVGFTRGLRALGREVDEADLFICCGSEARDTDTLARDLEQAQEATGRAVIDAFLLEYVSPSDDLDALTAPNGVLAAMRRWRDGGQVRFVGASAHDRPTARRLIESGSIDLLMHRYNMAHRGAEQQVFPAAEAHGVPVVAFTATRWGSLLDGHSAWHGPAPGAADCYRFSLRPAPVALVLSAPQSQQELAENVRLLRGATAMSRNEYDRWCEFGDLVYGDGTDRFETTWP